MAVVPSKATAAAMDGTPSKAGSHIRPAATPAQQIGAAVSYGVVSLSLFLALKTVISSLEFHATFFTLSAQLTFGVVLCLAFKWSLVKKAIPVGALFMANNAAAFIGIRLVPAPLFLAVRRTAIGLIMLTEWAVLGRRPSAGTVASILLVVLGAVVAGWDSIQSGADAVGFAYILFSNCLAALSLTYARKYSDDTGVRGLGLVMYTGLTGAPIGWLLGVWNGEVATTLAYPSLASAAFVGGILLYCSLGTAMNYTQNLCSLYNSPLVSAVVGVLKDVVSTLVSAVVFTGYDATAQSVTGLVLSFVGASAFSYVKLTAVQPVSDAFPDKLVLPTGPTGSAPHLTPGNSPQRSADQATPDGRPPTGSSGSLVPAALGGDDVENSPGWVQGGDMARGAGGGVMPTAEGGVAGRGGVGYTPPHTGSDDSDVDAAEMRPLLGAEGGGQTDHALDRQGPASPFLGSIAASAVGAVSKRLTSFTAGH